MKDRISEKLQQIVDPALGKIVAIALDGAQARVMIEVDPSKGKELEPMRQAAQRAIEDMPGVEQALVVLTAEKNVPPPPQKNFSHKISSRPVAPKVRHMIAVASGKGGVGKSTVAANLALAFAQGGWKTGLLDADIYGSSQPTMMGLRLKPEVGRDDMIVPPMAHGMKVMSMGFFVGAEAPVIWRGPMVHSAIQQLLRDVDWGDLDVLVIDLPPGTGDAQLSLAQYVPLSGAVIVSTPQDVALSEAKKAFRMFEKTKVPVLGMVENMSYHTCSSCGHREDIFDHGGARDAAAALGIAFLGEIPLSKKVREMADAGTPVVAGEPQHPAAKVFTEIAAGLRAGLETQAVSKKAAKN